MNSRIDIQNELRELNSSLPLAHQEPVFNVPDGFFENFAESVMAKIKGEQSVEDELANLSPVLAGLPRTMPFAVPDGYFEQSAEELPALIQEEPLPAVLIEAGKSVPYQVPSHYFEQLPKQILAAIGQKEEAKVISISSSRKWMRFAVAAVFAGLVGFSSFFYFNGDSSSVDPVKQPEAWVAKKLKNISNQELEDFIQTADVSIAGDEMAQNSKPAKSEVKKMLRDVTDTELDAFLSQVPTDNEELMIIN